MDVPDIEQNNQAMGSEDSWSLQEQARDVDSPADVIKSADKHLTLVVKEQTKLLKQKDKRIEQLETTVKALHRDKIDLTQQVYSLTKAADKHDIFDEDEKREFVYLDEYEELEEENEALKKRLVELRTELSNTKNLLKRAANGQNVTVALDTDALKKKDETIEALRRETNDMRSQRIALKAEVDELTKKNAKLAADNEALREGTSVVALDEKNEKTDGVLGLSADQWKAAYLFDLKHDILSRPQHNAVKKAMTTIGFKFFTPAEETDANRALQALKAHGFNPYAAVAVKGAGGSAQSKKKKKPEPASAKTSAQKQPLWNDFLGLTNEQWKEAYGYAENHALLSSVEIKTLRKVITCMGKTYITRAQEDQARKVLQALKAHGFKPGASVPAASNESAKPVARQKAAPIATTRDAAAAKADKRLLHYIKLFQSLDVSCLLGSPAPHNPILLIAIMNLVERKVYNNPLIVPGGTLEREFDAVWRSLVPKDCRYPCAYWKPFWYMKSEPFWTIVPRDGVSFEGKEWLSDKEWNTIAGARLDEDLFKLMQTPEAREVLKMALIEKYLPTNKPPTGHRGR